MVAHQSGYRALQEGDTPISAAAGALVHLLERVGNGPVNRQRFPALALLQMRLAADVVSGDANGGFVGCRIIPAVSAWSSMNMRAFVAPKVLHASYLEI